MMVDIGTVRENVIANITDMPSQYWMRAMYLLFIDNLLQEMDTRLLVAQNHHVIDDTTTAGESDTGLPRRTRCGSKSICHGMEGNVEDGQCR